jgi:hypothetical protein
MGKYADLDSDIFSVFGSQSWQDENIKTFPSNIIESNAGDEYIRVQILPSGSGVNLDSVAGIMIIQIFISAGKGPSRASFIADKLDKYLVGKSLTTSGNGVTQFQNSSVKPDGIDKDNSLLYRSSYTIYFNYFGVS